MTSNQINMLRHLEDLRHNAAMELETMRSNKARESETKRSNLATETETRRSNLANESYRNLALLETGRHNLMSENIGIANVREVERSNKAHEKEINRHNVEQETETSKHNRSDEKIRYATVESTNRLNEAKATAESLKAVGSLIGGTLGFLGAIG